MKTKQDRWNAFRDAVNSLVTSIGADSRDYALGERPRDIVDALFDAECNAAADAMTCERDKINVALTVIDATDWVQFPESLQKATTDVLENYLKDDKET